MASLTLGGAAYAIAPFKLRELRLAAPHIDRLAARGSRFDTVEALTEAAADMIGVIAVGVADTTPEALLAQVGLNDLDALRQAFEAVLAEAGLQRGDPATETASPPGEPRAGVAADP